MAELEFVYDQSIAGQDRIEQLLNEIRTQGPTAPPDAAAAGGSPDTDDDDDQP